MQSPNCTNKVLPRDGRRESLNEGIPLNRLKKHKSFVVVLQEVWYLKNWLSISQWIIAWVNYWSDNISPYILFNSASVHLKNCTWHDICGICPGDVILTSWSQIRSEKGHFFASDCGDSGYSCVTKDNADALSTALEWKIECVLLQSSKEVTEWDDLKDPPEPLTLISDLAAMGTKAGMCSKQLYVLHISIVQHIVCHGNITRLLT